MKLSSTLSPIRTITIVALFSSLIIASDYALAPILNVKLMDTLVFSSAYAFGFKVGAYIAITSELIWSFASPYGFAGYIMPFLIAGELVFALAGYAASRIWGSPKDLSGFSEKNAYFGAILALCAAFWDFETNIGTAVIAGARTFEGFLFYQLSGVFFSLAHEISDFVLGAFLAPVIIVYFYRVFGTKASESRVAARASTTT
jgi:hypothetical protein